MTVTELREKPDKPEEASGFTIPREIKDKVDRGRPAMRKDAPIRRVCQKFWEGDHYWYVNGKNELAFLPSAVIDVQRGKPLHRVRHTYNYIQSIVESKVSAASQRMPGFQVDPASGDQQDYEQARICEQVAIWGYDHWKWRRETNKTITNAVVQREGFVYPYFDPEVGPFTQDKGGKWKGQGEVRLLNLSRSQVMWEPGMDFMDSRWHAVERGMLPDEIEKIPGFIGGSLDQDAQTADIPEGKKSNEMTAVVEYLERPSSDYPQGRKCWIANGRIIVDYRKAPECPENWTDWFEPYPNINVDGTVFDEPVLHRLSYTVNADGDDLGLVERLIDLQRTINDCWNKLLEWKNRCLMPQAKAPRGSNPSPRSDVPGAVTFYNPIAGQTFEWEQVPPVPRELFEILNLAIEQMRALAADVDVQPDPRLTAQTANAAIQSAQDRWQSFLGDLADFHSRLMRHCLALVARFYTEERVIQIRGQYGWEPSISFTGQDIQTQMNVRVLPGSIEAKSRQQTSQDLQMMATLFPGSVMPEAVWASLHGGAAEGLLESHEKDVSRAWRVIQRLREGPKAMASFPPRMDLDVGDPLHNFMVPGWMPRKMDNVAVWKQVVADYCKTTDFDTRPPATQEMFYEIYNALEMLEQRLAMQSMMQSQDMAAQLGQQNAAAPQPTPQQATPQPLTRDQAKPSALTPKQ